MVEKLFGQHHPVVLVNHYQTSPHKYNTRTLYCYR